MKFTMMSVQSQNRFIPLTVRWTAGTPAVVEGTSQASVADTGTGIATLTFTNPFARKPVISACCEAATGVKTTAHLRSVSQTGFILEVNIEDGSLDDSTVDIHIHVWGSDSADEL